MISDLSRVRSSLSLDQAGKRVATTTVADPSVQPPAKKQRIVCNNLVIKPSDYVLSAFRANGVRIEEVRKRMNQKFIAPSKEMMETYTWEVLDAVRKNDLETVKKLHADKKLLVNGCNKFGDSLLHLACRRSHTGIAEFLMKDMKVNVNIRDDYHRTPLHDATWTAEPNFELVNMLIKEAPELLLMEDVRGFTPFDYVRPSDWKKWLRFLWERKTMLLPKDESPSE